MTFVKLDANIITSSVWAEDSDTLRVWIYLLATADAGGVVRATVPGIAIQCSLAVAVVQSILAKFEAPDPNSRTAISGGRRVHIEHTPQFEIHLLNYARYRRKDHTAAARKRHQREREKSMSRRDVTMSRVTPRDVTQAEVEVEEEKTKTHVRPSCPPDFETFWAAYPRKAGKRAALAVWNSLSLNGSRPALEVLVASVKAHAESDQWCAEGGRFIPHPATYLRQGRWDDELEGQAATAVDDSPPERRQYLAEAVAHGKDQDWSEYERKVLAQEIPVGWDAFVQHRGGVA